MSYDVAALKRALDRFTEQRTERELARVKTVRELNERYPRLAEIEGEISSCGLMIVENVMKGGDAVEENVMRIKARVRALRDERAAILKQNGLPADIIDGRYACPLCGDTGYVGSEMCACLREIYRQEQYKELSELFSLADGRIEAFDETLYSAVKTESESVTPREYMQLVAAKCRKYALGFSTSSPNLLFCGESGSGKTFLMACIARSAVERDASVVYRSAFALAKLFEDERFSKTGEAEDALARCVKCDLLLIDNLGTEMTTAYTNSALYQLINQRIAEKHPTLISTAMNTDEIAARYGPHMSARLRADFVLLPVYPRADGQSRGRNILEI